jgi:hypothetical protein
MLGVFTRLRQVDVSVESIRRDAETKVDFINQKLSEGHGSDADWVRAMSTNDFVLVEYLMKFLHTRVESKLSNAAAQCLAFAGNMYPNMWQDFVYDEHRLDDLMTCAMRLMMRLSALSLIKDDSTTSMDTAPYLGFDVRDVKDFNLEGFDENLLPPDTSGAEDAETRNMTVLTFLLLLSHFFDQEITSMKYSVDTSSFKENETIKISEFTLKEVTKEFRDTLAEGSNSKSHEKISRLVQSFVRTLILMQSSFSEDAYLSTLKVMCGLNRQCPLFDVLNSTEVAKMCSLFQESSGAAISQGLLHLLNDIGTPAHTTPEVVPILLMFNNLINLSGAHGFFYTNDIQVIIDIIMRELANIPFACDTEIELQYLESIRVYYMKIATSLSTHEAWKSYKEREMRDTLEFVISSTNSCEGWEPDLFSWSREAAQELLESSSELAV